MENKKKPHEVGCTDFKREMSKNKNQRLERLQPNRNKQLKNTLEKQSAEWKSHQTDQTEEKNARKQKKKTAARPEREAFRTIT